MRLSDSAFRYCAALALGGLALLVNLWTPAFISDEGPRFFFGGIFVLYAFVRLGFRPGVAAGVASLLNYWARLDLIGAVTVVYLLEAISTYLLYRRFRSLVFSVLVFWFGVGWVLDLALYGRLLHLDGGYLAILFFKQFANGVLNTAAAEAFLALPFPDRLRVRMRPVTLHQLFFGRVFAFLTVPMAFVGLFAARAEYNLAVAEHVAELRQAGDAATAEVRAYLGANEAALARLAQLVQLDRMAGDVALTETRVRTVQVSQRDFYNIGVVDSEGNVEFMSPEADAQGHRLAAGTVRERDYFAAARATMRPSVSTLILGTLHVRRAIGVEPILILAEPLVRADAGFDGIVIGALDVFALGSAARPTEPSAVVLTIVDRESGVIYSTDSARAPGELLEGLVPREFLRPNAKGTGKYQPTGLTPLQGRMAVDSNYVSSHPVGVGGLTVLAEVSASDVRAWLLPRVSYGMGFILVVIVLTYLLTFPLSASLARPMVAVGRAAERLADPDAPPLGDLEDLRNADVEEVRILAERLSKVGEDLAERRRLQQEITARRMESVGQLAAGVAHGLNNALTPITLAAESLLLGPEGPEETREDLQVILNSARRASGLVGQLAVLGGRQIFRPTALDLNREVLRFADARRPALDPKVILDTSLTPGMPLLNADAGQLELALNHLVTNSIEAARGPCRILIATAHSAPGQSPLNGAVEGVRLTISDDGPGIPADRISKVFDPFYTTKKSTSPVGLGLSVVHAIMAQHNGLVKISAAERQGTEVHLFFPVEETAG